MLKDERPNVDRSYYEEQSFVYNDYWGVNNIGSIDDDITFASYTEMRYEDAQVKAAVQVIVLASLSKGYKIYYTGNDKRGSEIVEYLEGEFENVNSCSNYMVSGLEEVLEEIMDNRISYGLAVSEPVLSYSKEDKQVHLDKLKVINPETIETGIKRDKFGNVTSVKQDLSGAVPLNPDKLLISLGRSQLQSVYKHWFIKDVVTKFWNIALERYGTPLLIGFVRKKNDLASMNSALDSVRTKTNLSVLKGDDVKKIDAVSEGENFSRAVGYHDTMIMRGLLVPTLLLGQEDVGARALGETHLKIFMWRIQRAQKMASDMMQQLIRLLVDLNYGKIDKYPELVFPDFTIREKKEMADVIKVLIDGQVISPDEKWIRKELGIPEKKNDGTSPITDVDDKPPVIADVPEQEDVTGNPDSGLSAKLTSLKWPEDVRKVESVMDSGENKLKQPLLKYINFVKKYLKDNAQKILDDEKVVIPKAKQSLVDDVKDSLLDTQIAGTILAANAISQLKGNVKLSLQGEEEWASIRAALILNQFNITMTADAMIIINLAIEEGTSVDELSSQLAERVEFRKTSPQGIRAITRTNINAAFNEARLRMYNENSDFVRGVQYSAIIDTRTTPFCVEHDGMTLPLNSPRVQEVTPPNHFQCRSYWIAVTVIDENVVWDWTEGETSPQEGFERAIEAGL